MTGEIATWLDRKPILSFFDEKSGLAATASHANNHLLAAPDAFRLFMTR